MNSGDASFIPLAMLKAAYAKLGIEVTGKAMPTKRCLEEADMGLTDGEVVRIQGIEHKYKNLVRITVPVDSFEVVAITLKPFKPIRSYNDLLQYKVGTRSGVQFAENATKRMSSVTRVKEWDTLFDLLAMKRVDVIIATPHTLERQSQRLNTVQFIMHTPPLESIPLYHYLHKRHQALVPAITEALEEMRANGDLARIKKAHR